MPNYLKMPKKAQVLALLELDSSYRRIEAETGVRRETVGRYDRRLSVYAAKTFPGSEASSSADALDDRPRDDSKAAKTFAGSPSNAAKRSPARPARPVCRGHLSHRDHGETGRGSEPAAHLAGLGRGVRVRRELRIGEAVRADDRAHPPRRRRFSLRPGAEGQVDFFRGAPTLDAATGEWRRPWVFRMTLGHSRHGYEEAVWIRSSRRFSGCTSARSDLGGVPSSFTSIMWRAT